MPECAVSQLMGWMWWFMKLATMVTGLHSVRFPYIYGKYII
jgi:hypothetical protein